MFILFDFQDGQFGVVSEYKTIKVPDFEKQPSYW